MNHFRDRVILTPGNIPQLPSGRVVFSIGNYRIGLPQLSFNSTVPVASSGTALGAVNAYTINAPSVSLASVIPTSSKTATSP
jgi:hypothetical protein